jgi:hypothetical protein
MADGVEPQLHRKNLDNLIARWNKQGNRKGDKVENDKHVP